MKYGMNLEQFSLYHMTISFDSFIDSFLQYSLLHKFLIVHSIIFLIVFPLIVYFLHLICCYCSSILMITLLLLRCHLLTISVQLHSHTIVISTFLLSLLFYCSNTYISLLHTAWSLIFTSLSLGPGKLSVVDSISILTSSLGPVLPLPHLCHCCYSCLCLCDL